MKHWHLLLKCLKLVISTIATLIIRPYSCVNRKISYLEGRHFIEDSCTFSEDIVHAHWSCMRIINIKMHVKFAPDFPSWNTPDNTPVHLHVDFIKHQRLETWRVEGVDVFCRNFFDPVPTEKSVSEVETYFRDIVMG